MFTFYKVCFKKPKDKTEKNKNVKQNRMSTTMPRTLT